MIWRTRIAIFSLLAALGTVQGVAQVTTATFYGIVADPSGAAVPGAGVALIHEGTQAVRRQTTDQAGEFGFTFVAVGVYTLKIQAPGFKVSENRGIELRAAQSVRQTFVLQIGAVTETVEVASQAPLVNTVSAEQRESIATNLARELPLSRRSIAGLVTLSTGVTRSAGDVFLNGSGRGGTQVSVDGTDATGNPERPSIAMFGDFNYINVLSIEAVSEVQLVKGVIPAEYTRALGGNLNLITRSGTNELHGTLFENFRAENLNARNQFLATKPGVTFNQFGGSLGGPISKDRIFGFGVYEGYRERAFAPVSGNVPTQQLRDRMLRAVPAYRLWLDTVPLPNQPHDPAATTGRYVSAGSLKNDDNHFVIKPDWRVTNYATTSVTWTRFRPTRFSPRVQQQNFRSFDGVTDRLTASLTLFRAQWTSESRYGYNKNVVDRLDGIYEVKDPNKQEGKPGGRRIPCINALGFSGCGEILHLGAPNHSFDQKVALTSGRHSLKFGGVLFRRSIGRSNIENPDIRYQNEADLLANIPNIVQLTFGIDDYTAKAYEWGLFFQDDWRVTPRLVLNLGLRNDFFGHYVARGPNGGPPHSFNYAGYLDNKFTLAPLRPIDNPYDNDSLNLAPRFGFSFNPDGKGRNVIRGGWSTMFTNMAGETFTQTVQNAINEPFRSRFSRQEALSLGLRYPAYNEDVLPLVRGGSPGSPRVLDPHMKAAYAMNFYLGYQRELAQNMVLETAFVGNRGVKWQTSRIANEVDRITGLRPNPLLATMDYWDNADSTRYLSWQSSLRRRYSHNLTANLHYTWGKAIAYGSGDTGWTASQTQDFFDLRSNRGLSAGSVLHTFSADFVYDLPKFVSLSSPVARHVMGGWQLSGIVTARTGGPINVTQPSALSGSRPDYVSGSPTLSDARKTLQYLNPAAFRGVPVSRVGATIRPGNLGRNALRAAGLVNLDFSLGKNFSLTERMRLQFRADMFDATNHTNFSGIDTNLESRNFGRFTSTTGAREIQLNARLTF